jgi:hypothetical protein
MAWERLDTVTRISDSRSYKRARQSSASTWGPGTRCRTLRSRDDRGAKGFRGGFLGWGGGALRVFMGPAFARVDGGPAAVTGPLPGEFGMVDSDCVWWFADRKRSGSSSDDAYASIPGGRLADTSSGPSLSDLESESASGLKCDDAVIDGGRTLSLESVSLAIAIGNDDDQDWDWSRAEEVISPRGSLISCLRFRPPAPRPPRPRPRTKFPPPLPCLVLIGPASDGEL